MTNYDGRRFVSHLRMDDGQCQHILDRADPSPSWDIEPCDALASLLVRPHHGIEVYPLPHLSPWSGHPSLDYPLIEGPQGVTYRFIPPACY